MNRGPFLGRPVFGAGAFEIREMTPEEIHQELADIKKMLFEIKSAFDHFTTEKKQNWKDEARRRERTWHKGMSRITNRCRYHARERT